MVPPTRPAHGESGCLRPAPFVQLPVLLPVTAPTAIADFLHTYNHHRCHTALAGKPPISRVNNAANQYT